MTGYTTVLVQKQTRERLAGLKEYRRESYDEVIERLIAIFERFRSEGELTGEAKADIEEARRQIRAGKGLSTRELMRQLGI